MFEVDPHTTWIDPAAGAISSVVQSLNTPLVAAGTHAAESVQSWIVARPAMSGGAVDVVVYFHLTQSNQAVLYRWSEGPVAGPQVDVVREEAMSFCESMGFMMDDLNFSALPAEKRTELLETLPPFTKDLNDLVAEVQGIVEPVRKKADPLEDFVKMKQAREASGQMGTGEFMAAQGEPVHDGGGMVSGKVFDPSQHVDRADAPHLLDENEIKSLDEQIEITEIEGLELMPEPVAEPLMNMDLEVTSAEPPPVVRGSFADPAPVPTPRMVKERTPSQAVNIIDDPAFAAAAPVAAPPRTPSPSKREISIDEMLAGVTGGEGDEVDLASQLDDILDNVENSQPRISPPVASNGNGHAEYEEEDPMKLLDALTAHQEAEPTSIPVAPPPRASGQFARPTPTPPPAAAPAPMPAARVPAPSAARAPMPTPAPAPITTAAAAQLPTTIMPMPPLEEPAPMARPSAAVPAAPVDSFAAAWTESGTNGHANGAAAAPAPPASPAAPRLQIATEDLARLLAML